MTGETQHIYAISSTNSGPKQDKDFSLGCFAGNDGRDLDHRLSDNSDLNSRGCNNSGTVMMLKEKEPQTQREAIIRPQQAGKIDFKSLYNRPKFISDGIWNNGKGGPQSPNGKGRVKEKTKRSGKGDRNQHQLYRLSINNARSNPTIGIAYPQQKVTPPKKSEVSDGPVSGSYRFHVPSIPEREAELHQEDLNFHRCYQKVSSSLTSTNSTSQTKAAPHQHHDLKLQQHAVSDHEGSGINGQHHYLEFQDNGSDSWQSPEKNFTCSSYGASVQKTSPFPEGNKSDPNGFGSVPYQYPFQPLHKSSADLFANDSISQDYLDAAIASKPTAPGAFAFHSSANKGLETSPSSAYDNLLKDSRTFNLPSQQTAFLHVQQVPMVQRQPALPGYKGRNEHSTEHNGAILSSGAMTSSGAINQTTSTFQDSQTIFSSNKFSLHGINAPVSNRHTASGDSLPSQRPLLRRTSPSNPLSQMHFQNKGYSSSSVNNVIAGPVACENSVLPTGQSNAQLWDVESSAYVTVDQNTASYPAISRDQFTYQCHSSIEQRSVLNNSRIPWQQVNHMTAMANDKRVEQPRQPANSEPALTQADSEFKGTNHALNKFAQHKPSDCHNSELMACDEIASQRNGSVAQNCGASNNSYYHDGATGRVSPLGDRRNKKQFFGANQQVLPTSLRTQSGQSVVLPLSALAESSPDESPMSSPVPNTLSSSTCSSLSPMSNSPVNPSSEENYTALALTSSPFFNQPCQAKGNKMFHSPNTLHPSSLHYHKSDHSKAFCFPQEMTKDDQVSKYIQENQFHKQSTETSNVCVNNFEIEPPPPPYSSHHLLANSLSTASLDQLDVLLTCKQCDQNYSNLSSFLEHRQYCGLRAIFQTEMKDTLRGPEKVTMNSLKPVLPIPGLPLLKGLSDVHEHLHGSNTCADFLFTGDSKGDTKDEPLKGNMFHGLTTNPLSVHASDLDMDEAKLDSLITEALNEIDSSFMDVFVDEELSMIKAQPCKIKDFSTSEITEKAQEFPELPTYRSKNMLYFEKDTRQKHTENNRMSGRRRGEKKGVATKFIDSSVSRHLQQVGAENQSKGKILANVLCKAKESDEREKQKTVEKPNDILQASVTSNQPEMSDLMKIQPDRKSIASYEKDQVRPNPTDLCITEEKKKCPRTPLRDKKKNSRNGTWSKELIHKIVQQKNKLHKLHIKNEKKTLHSLVTERSQTTKQILSYGEFDYVSESDDDVEYLKKHTRNKPTERLKYTFTSEPLGTSERLKEPAWKCRKTKEFQTFSRDSDSEAVSKDLLSPVSGRERSIGSSSSSVSSDVGLTKEVSSDSGNEKEAEVKINVSQRSNHGTFLEKQPTIDPLKEAQQIEISKGTKRFASAKFLLTTSNRLQGKANIVQPNNVNEEPLLPAQRNQMTLSSKSCKSPEVLICKEKTSDEQHKPTNHTNKKAGYQSISTGDCQQGSHQFSSYNESSLDYHMEEVNHQLHIDNKSNITVHEHRTEVDMPYSKESRLCDNPKDYRYCNRVSHSIDCTFTAKDHCSCDKNSDSYEQKAVSSNYSPHPLQLTAIDTSELNGTYPYTNSVTTSSFVHGTPNAVSIRAEHTHEKVSSPPSFHSSSFFGGLALSGFERPLYSDVSVAKENCASYRCNDSQSNKSTLFDQEYPTFLPEKDWELMHEMTPLLSEENFCNPLDEKHHDTGIAPSNQIPAEASSGCSVPFMNNMSVDELEIKRLVTELESHLQTTIPSSHVLSQSNTEHQMSKEFEGPNLYSTLPVDPAPENEKSLFLLDELNNLSNAHQAQAKSFVGVNLDNDSIQHPTLEQCYETPRSLWSYNIPFDALEKISLPLAPKTSELADPYCSKVEGSQFGEAMQNLPDTQSTSPKVTSYHFLDAQHDTGLPCLSSEEHTLISNSSTHTEITASLPLLHQDTEEQHSKKEDTVKALPNPHTENDLHEPNRIDKTFDDPPKLEPFETSAPTFQLEFELQDESVPVLNMATTSQHCISNSVDPTSSRSKIHEPVQGPPASVTDEHRTFMGEKALDNSSLNTLHPLHVKSDDSKCVRFDMPKEEVDDAGGAVLGQQTTVNPLQDLQLFVARTAKNNEEEMLMPCFPGLLCTILPISNTFTDEQGVCEKAGSPTSENALESTANHQGSESNALVTDSAAKQECTPLMPEFTKECKEPISTGDQSATESESCPANSFKSSNSELKNCEPEKPHLGDECSELDDTDISADAVSKNQDNLLSFREATLHPLKEEAKKEHQIENLQEADENRAALTFDKPNQAIYSNQVSLETEAVDSLMKPALLVCEATVSQHCHNSCSDGQLSSVLHLDAHSTPADLNSHHKEKWGHFQTQVPKEPDFSRDTSHHQQNDILYPTLNEMPESDAVRLSEILNASFCKEDSSNSLPLLKKSITDYKELAKSQPENHSYQLQLPEKKPVCSQKALKNSELLSPLAHVTFEEGHGHEIGLFPLTPPDCSATLANMGSSHCNDSLADKILSNVDHSEQHVSMRSHCDNVQLENSQFHMNNTTQSFLPPPVQNILDEMLPECKNSEPMVRHVKEHGECPSIDMGPNSQLVSVERKTVDNSTIESTGRSTLSVDLLTAMNNTTSETIAQFAPEMNHKNYFTYHKEHKHNLQEALNGGVSPEEKSVFPRTDLTRPLDVNNFGLDAPHIEEPAGTNCSEASSDIGNCVKGDISETSTSDYLDPVMSGVLNILNCEKSKAIFRALSLPSSSVEPKCKKATVALTCDICSASFRSKAGLTRHKAVKHSAKPEGSKLATVVEAGVVIPKKVLKTLKTDNSKALTSLPEQKSSLGHHQEDHTQKVEEESIVLGEQSKAADKATQRILSSKVLNERPRSNSPVSEKRELFDLINEKSTPKQPQKEGEKIVKQLKDTDLNGNSKNAANGNVRKRKVKTPISNSSESQVPSDEILNIIKTNILKAITYPGQISSNIVEGSCERQQSHISKEVGGKKHQLNHIASDIVPKTVLKVPLLDAIENVSEKTKESIPGKNHLADQEWIDGYLRHVEQNGNDESVMGPPNVVKIKDNERQYSGAVGGNMISDEESLNYGSSSPVETQRTLQLIEAELAAIRDTSENRFDGVCFTADSDTGGERLTDSKDAGDPDLNSLFDDDVTFSLLFPRDDHFTRRKCTRVYGKRNKTMPPAVSATIRETESAGVFANEPGLAFTGERSIYDGSMADPSITLNDSLMLDVCHGSKPSEMDPDSNSCENAMLHLDYQRQSSESEAIDMDSDTLLTFLCQNQQLGKTAHMQEASSLNKRQETDSGGLLARETHLRSSNETDDKRLFLECNPDTHNLGNHFANKKGRNTSDFKTTDMELLSTKKLKGEYCFESAPGETEHDLKISKSDPTEKSNQKRKRSKSQSEEKKIIKHVEKNPKRKSKQYKCRACFQRFRTVGDFHIHKFSHHPFPPPTCYMCVQRKFTSREQLKDHLKDKHAKNKAGFWMCGMCLKEISDVWMYNEHLREHATQFARNGQAQSVLGLHGCFADEAAVHSFLTRFIYQKPNTSSKHTDPVNNLKIIDSDGSVEIIESNPQENLEIGGTQSKSICQSSVKDSNAPEHVMQKDTKNTSPSSQPHVSETASPLPESVQTSDVGQKNAPIHPQCKDPSRDCHHCGKQFPKPFKLQRHLVVHSLQKLFLCHKCPMFFPDVQELRSHLRQQHGVLEESEIKHTTLYTCEMCADVMHVIKKSFICSTCNYTFSKKEQFERHMEKHLVGGIKTFKFRRVMRPGSSGTEARRKLKEDKLSECTPPPKRRTMPGLSPIHDLPTISLTNNNSSDLPSISKNSPTPQTFFAEQVSHINTGMPETSVKMEGEGEYTEETLPVLDEAQPYLSSLPPCLSPPMLCDMKRDPELDDIPTLSINEPNNQDFDTKPPLPLPDTVEFSGESAKGTFIDKQAQKESPKLCTEPPTYTLGEKTFSHDSECERLVILEGKPSLQEHEKENTAQSPTMKNATPIEFGSHLSEANKLQNTFCKNVNAVAHEESALRSSSVDIPQVPVPLKEKVELSQSNKTSKDLVCTRKGSADSQSSNKLSLKGQNILSNMEPAKSYASKEKATADPMNSAKEGNAMYMKEAGGNHQRTPNVSPTSPFVSNTVKHSNSDVVSPFEKPSFSSPLKTCPKKRKDNLTLSYKSSSNSRENMPGQGKKITKKARVGLPRNESQDSVKKQERSNGRPTQSRSKEEALSKSFHCKKPKTVVSESQIKKMVLDTYYQKKVDGRRHSTGEHKHKKEVLGRMLHPIIQKTSGPPLSSSLHKHKSAHGYVKPTDCLAHRTAESQNNILSKLFGQKLTSFKIPLRRDISE